MKKILISTIAASSILLAANNGTYELTPMVGKVYTKQHVDIKNHTVAGVALGFNQDDNCKFDQIEVGILQSSGADYENSTENTSITQLLVNGIKEFKTYNKLKIFGLVGLGYEKISNEQFNNDSSALFEYGVGAKYRLNDSISIRGDIRHQLKFDGDKNLVYLIGLSIPFGTHTQTTSNTIKEEPKKEVVESEQKPAVVKEEVKQPIILDDDKDGIVNDKDMCPNTPANMVVNSNGCQLDDDKDGVVNSKDICPNSTTTNVDNNGCAKITQEQIKALETPADLGILFETNSAVIKNGDIPKFAKYVKYLKATPDAKIIIEAHTDSKGSAKYNLQLSQKRADSTKMILINKGIKPDRITAIGYGESKPLVPNDTAENRRKNRRVTARIIK